MSNTEHWHLGKYKLIQKWRNVIALWGSYPAAVQILKDTVKLIDVNDKDEAQLGMDAILLLQQIFPPDSQEMRHIRVKKKHCLNTLNSN